MIYLPQCHSTNEEASKYAASNENIEGTVLMTDFQNAGRGQRGNVWESEREKNIMASVILNPKFINPTAQFSLHTVCSLAIFDTLFPLIGRKLKIKWPNDIYYGDKKICGILIENSIRRNSIDTSIIGIGLNVNQLNFKTENATSLKEIMMKELDRNDLTENLLQHLEKRYLQLKSNKISALRTEYALKLYRINETHIFESNEGKFIGEILGVNEYGQLLIQQDSVLNAYDFKEVKFSLK